MLNEEKIRLMTRLTVYDEGLGIKDGRTAEYFRNDYVLFGLVGSFVAGTLAWGICALVYCGYCFEDIFFSVYENELGTYLRLAATSYIVFILLFLLITMLIYYRRSASFARRRRMYEQDLEALTEICDIESGITQAPQAVTGFEEDQAADGIEMTEASEEIQVTEAAAESKPAEAADESGTGEEANTAETAEDTPDTEAAEVSAEAAAGDTDEV